MTKLPVNSRSYNFYPSILESIAEGIVVIGTDKKILFINKMAKALIGLGDENTEGLACAEVINTDLCSKNCPLDSSDSNTSCSHNAYLMNIYLHKKDASMVPLCLNVAPLNDEKGNMIGIIENFRPMSEAVRVIESLEQSNVLLSQEKNKISSIVNSLADGVFTVDKDLCITSFNKGMESLTGQKEPDVIGHKCSEILHADNCAGDCPFLHTMKQGYGRANVMERIEGKDGNVFPVLISTAFLKDGSQDTGLIATIRDASELEKLRKEVNDRYKFSNIIGKSDPVQQIFELIETLGYTDCAVLIEGESGTGKELVARAIHHESDRRNKPFVKVNCSAIVEGLFESELFGHVRGSFTGAIKDKIGKFEQADGGTIFLDEIGEMPVALQSKLLRVLQDMEFEKVGDTKTVRVDVRIIAATNKNLKNEINANNFREDLYYRLCVVPVQMPPLRERREDIPLLVSHFLGKLSLKTPNRPAIAEVTKTALAALMDHDWPGNIRELENAIEHAFIRTKTNIIDIDSLPLSVTRDLENSSIRETEKSPSAGEKTEKHHIQMLLRKYNGSKAKVAKDLGLSRTTLWRKFKKYNISVN
ncbi:MAG: PAS domain S-box protein [Nitrospiraceae bacterium]|nr:MAG: PAS domain S-box protein [Nitrospiraceae bacterium]